MTNPQTELTKRIIDSIKDNIYPWREAWFKNNTGLPSNINGKKYSGGNILLLICHSSSKKLSSKWWATRKQWDRKGGKVVTNPFDAAKVSFFMANNNKCFSRNYEVFNVEHVEGKSKEYSEQLDEFRHQRKWDGDFAPAEQLVNNLGVKIYDGDSAVYITSEDLIEIPKKNRFRSPPHYYESLFHELFHWSCSKTRLNKKRDTKRLIAQHELAAELCACFLAAELGLHFDTQLMVETKAYIQRWIQHSETDSRFVWSAARMASNSVEFLLTNGGHKT